MLTWGKHENDRDEHLIWSDQEIDRGLLAVRRAGSIGDSRCVTMIVKHECVSVCVCDGVETCAGCIANPCDTVGYKVIE